MATPSRNCWRLTWLFHVAPPCTSWLRSTYSRSNTIDSTVGVSWPSIAAIAISLPRAKPVSQRLLESCSRNAVQNGSNTNRLSISNRIGPLNLLNKAWCRLRCASSPTRVATNWRNRSRSLWSWLNSRA